MNTEQNSLRKSIPEVDVICQTIIEALRSGRGKSFLGIENDVAKILGLTSEQKNYRIGTSKTTLFGNRVSQGRSELHKEGFIEYPKKGKARLTNEGKTLLSKVAENNTMGVSDADKSFEEPQEFSGREQVKEKQKVSYAVQKSTNFGKNPISGTDSREYSVQNIGQKSTSASTKKKEQSLGSSSKDPYQKASNQGSLNKKEERNLLSLVLAIIGLALSVTGTWFAGLALIAIALTLFFKQQKVDSKVLVAPKTTIGVSVLGVLLALSSCTGALMTDQEGEAEDSIGSPPPVVEVEDQQAVLTLEVVPEEWAVGDGEITVEIVCTEGEGLGFKDSRTVTPGKRYKINDKEGHYVFTVSVEPSAGSKSLYKDEKKSYQFQGKKDYAFVIELSIDEAATEEAALRRAEAERAIQEAEEQRQREEEAAAAEAAAAEAAAAEAAAIAEAERQAQSNEVVVYITNTGAKYHAGGCRHLAKSKIETTKSSAISRGYEPCKNCRPG